MYLGECCSSSVSNGVVLNCSSHNVVQACGVFSCLYDLSLSSTCEYLNVQIAEREQAVIGLRARVFRVFLCASAFHNC